MRSITPNSNQNGQELIITNYDTKIYDLFG